MPLLKTYLQTFGPWVVALFVLSLPTWAFDKAIDLPDSFGPDDVAAILGLLIFISLLVERTLEVFVGTVRNPKSSLKKAEIKALEQRVADAKGDAEGPADPAELGASTEKLRVAEEDLIKYKSTTLRISLWTALSIGFLVSAVGIKTLESIFGTKVIEGLDDTQEAAFQVTDVLLTGGLIAGGSEGIHRVANVYNGFMDFTADKTKEDNKKRVSS